MDSFGVDEAQSPVTNPQSHSILAIIGASTGDTAQRLDNKKPAHPVWIAGRFAYMNRASTKSQTAQSGSCFLLFFLVSAISDWMYISLNWVGSTLGNLPLRQRITGGSMKVKSYRYLRSGYHYLTTAIPAATIDIVELSSIHEHSVLELNR